MEENKYFAFISYSRKDLDVAKQIKSNIESITGKICWMDMEGIESGEQFVDVIVSAIDNSKYVIFLLSDNSMSSKYAQKEITYADKVGKKLIPLNIDRCTPKGWFLFNFGEVDVIDIHIHEQLEKFYSNIRSWSSKLNLEKPFPSLFLDESGKKMVLYLIFLIDSSGSMYGERMEALNTSLASVLENFSIINPDIDIKINVLQFSSGYKWMYAEPINVEFFRWKYIDAGGLTDLGDACHELNNAMSKRILFSLDNCPAGFMPPVLFLITDGEPTDNYLPYMGQLWDNPFFKKSNKFAIGLGDDSSIDALKLFTKNQKQVFVISDETLNEFKALVTRLLTISMYAGSMSSLNEE